MIRPLTKNEFINIATNGIKINLYNNFVEDYIQNLNKFIEEVTQDFYISDFDNSWSEIAKNGISILKVCFEEDKINFYLKDAVNSLEDKKFAGIAIKAVYMHTVAWEAMNNNGEVHQPIESWPI